MQTRRKKKGEGKGGRGRARQGTCLDVLALRQGIKTLVHHFSSSISSVLGQQPGDVPQPHLGAGAELAAHGLQCLLCQLILKQTANKTVDDAAHKRAKKAAPCKSGMGAPGFGDVACVFCSSSSSLMLCGHKQAFVSLAGSNSRSSSAR